MNTQDLYKTREELKTAEEEFGTKIVNWDKWDELVKKTRQDIEKALKNYTPPKKRKQIYAYTLATKLPLVFNDSDQAASVLGIDRMVITNHARTQVPIYHIGVILSYQPINM